MRSFHIKLNHKIYEIACDPGEEARIEKLAEFIEEKIQFLKKTFQTVSDNHLLALTTLLLADDIFDKQDMIQSFSTSKISEEEIKKIDFLTREVSNFSEKLKSK